MKKWITIGLLAGAGLFLYKLLHKNPTGAYTNVYSPLNTSENRDRWTLLEYRDAGDGHYYVFIKYQSGKELRTDFILDNPDDISLWLKQAELDGATVEKK